MKKIFLVFVLILSLNFQNVSAQKYEDVIKFLPANLHFNSAVFEWEHQEGRRSIIVDIGIPYHHSIMDRNFGSFVVDPVNFKSADLYSYSARFAYRYYLTNNYPFGLYFEGYVKSQTMDWKASINNRTTGNVAGNINGYFYGVAPGIQLGYQYCLLKHMVLDFYIVGFEINNALGNATSYSSTVDNANYTTSFIKDLANQNLSNAKNKLDITKDSKNADYRLNNFAYPNFRLGVSVGYRF